MSVLLQAARFFARRFELDEQRAKPQQEEPIVPTALPYRRQLEVTDADRIRPIADGSLGTGLFEAA